VVIPDGAMDLVVPAEVTIGTLGASGVFASSWGWIVATNQTVTVADLDALDADGFESTIDDPQVTPSPTSLLNTALIGPLDPLEVGGGTSSEFQALLVPGETLVQPTFSFMQYGFNFPSGHVSSATATITATFENCVATYDTTVNFVAISSPRLVVNSAQRVPILCPPPAAPVPALTGWSLGSLGLLLVGVGLWRLARE
jgi:hypothetical protein